MNEIGFAFYPMKMELITPEQVDDAKDVKCFATTLGISQPDEINVNMKDIPCFDFFGEFKRSLSFC